CPTNAVCIDESGEGLPPSLSIPSSLPTMDTLIILFGPEAWIIQVRMVGVGSALNEGFMLTEPGNGAVSDVIASNLLNAGGVAVFGFELISDDESGNLHTNPCLSLSPACGSAVEDGTFQLAFSGFTIGDHTFDVYLKSD